MYVCSCDQIDYFSQESYKKCTWYFRIMVLIKMIIFKTGENAESVYYLFQISKMITKQIMRRLKEHLKQELTTKRLLCTNRKISFCKIWNFKKKHLCESYSAKLNDLMVWLKPSLPQYYFAAVTYLLLFSCFCSVLDEWASAPPMTLTWSMINFLEFFPPKINILWQIICS